MQDGRTNSPTEIVKQVESYLQKADFIPPSFQLLPRLLLLLEDPDSNQDSLAELIRVDPGLTADLLRICNSAAYGGRVRAESIQEAVFRMGFHEVHRVVMAVIASPVLQQPEKIYARKELDLWSHSLTAATAAELLAEGVQAPSEVAFTASLLHDIGKVVLAQAIPAQYAEVLHRSIENRTCLWAEERALLGRDHAQVGAVLLERWNFPASIVAAVRYHHEPASARGYDLLTACAYAANVLAYQAGNSSIYREYVTYPDEEALRKIGLGQPALNAMVDGVRERSAKLLESFQ